MRKVILVIFSVLTALTLSAQDFSNKGKDFWVTSGWHYGMGANNPPTMTLSMTSDVNTTFSIEAYGAGVITTGNITANQITTVNIPSTYFTYVAGGPAGAGNGLFNGKAIHITAVRPIVVYSFTTQAVSSAATLCLPTNVLGKQYYAASYTQISASQNANNFITIIAVEDNTVIEVIPTQLTAGGWAPNSVNTINLNKGQIYQVLGALTGTTGSDLTGTSIRSVASGSGGCKRIAVFSGSGRVLIGGCGNGADNLYQQLYPASTWGRKYLTVPSSGRLRNYYRIIRPAPTAIVRVNGAVIPAGSFLNNFYEFSTTTPNLIESDSVICVSQYFTSMSCQGNINPYDPDMVILNPVEQNIADVTLISTGQLTNTPITPEHYVHVIMKNAGTALSSFQFDGGPIPPLSAWVTHPQDPAYSYLYLDNISETSHSLKSDSGFNAIAYGYANAETYAYSAGTNVKDMYQQVNIQPEYGIETSPTVCTNAPFRFKISFPYCVDSIRWDLSALPGPPNPDVVTVHYTTCVAGPGGPDSIRLVNSVPVYWYSLPTLYSFPTVGTYPVSITAYTPNSSGCGSEQLIDFDLDVIDPPPASFTHDNPGCYADPVTVTETTPQTPKATYRQWWEFYDPATTPPTTTVYSNAANPAVPMRTAMHTFTTPGIKRIRHASIITTGCLSDTIVQTINLPDIPNATIAASNTLECVNSADNPTVSFTGTGGTAPYTFSYTINGALPAQTVTTAGTNASITIPVPTNVVGPFNYELVGVRNAGPAGTACTRTITNQKERVNIIQQATITLTSAASTINQTVCINKLIEPITYKLIGATNVSIPLLPPGLSYMVAGNSDTGNVVTITGAPTSTGGLPFDYTYNFTIQTGGTTCTPAITPVVLTVKPDHIISLNPYSPGSVVQFVCVNDPIKPIIFNLGGGATGVDLIANLPPGITYQVVENQQLVISGAPSVVSDETTYYITTNGSNCVTTSTSFKLTVHAYPLANAGPDKKVLEGGSVELEASGNATDLSYAWTPPQYLTGYTILRPRVTNPKADMVYRLTVTGPGGCQTNDQVFVKLLRIPPIPNTFSPNGDGINDQWRIDFLNDYPDARVQVFTRAGKLVFSSTGYDIKWDGTLKGKPLPFDTYYYIIEIGSGRDPVTGYVTIMK
ncbi:MAG: gliding motility-associated C-terminal domain-containing protein [Chitinophagaceae bacterium]|nr:gliding motility-associated C-terminal domain-containing protein [Chitinophagaceae bacterium]